MVWYFSRWDMGYGHGKKKVGLPPSGGERFKDFCGHGYMKNKEQWNCPNIGLTHLWPLEIGMASSD